MISTLTLCYGLAHNAFTVFKTQNKQNKLCSISDVYTNLRWCVCWLSVLWEGHSTKVVLALSSFSWLKEWHNEWSNTLFKILIQHYWIEHIQWDGSDSGTPQWQLEVDVPLKYLLYHPDWFSPWVYMMYYRNVQVKALVEFVQQLIWHISRQTQNLLASICSFSFLLCLSPSQWLILV